MQRSTTIVWLLLVASGVAQEEQTLPRSFLGGPEESNLNSTLYGPRAAMEQTGLFVISSGVTVTWSPEGDRAWGLNKSTGKWTAQKLDPPIQATPAVGDKIAIFRDENAVYAYSAEAGRWDVLRLKAGFKSPPIFESDMVVVTDKQDIYTFSAAVGRWTSPTGKAVRQASSFDGTILKDNSNWMLSPVHSSNPGLGASGGVEEKPTIKIFNLVSLPATDAAKIAEVLFESVRFAPDVFSNQLAARGSAAELNAVEALLLRLDDAAAERGREANQTTSLAAAGSFAPSETSDAAADIEALKKTYREREARVAATRRQLRGLLEQSTPEAAASLQAAVEKDQLRSTLHQEVREAFTAQQALHRAQLAKLRSRSQQLEEKIEIREQLQQAIIDRRVEELLKAKQEPVKR